MVISKIPVNSNEIKSTVSCKSHHRRHWDLPLTLLIDTKTLGQPKVLSKNTEKRRLTIVFQAVNSVAHWARSEGCMFRWFWSQLTFLFLDRLKDIFFICDFVCFIYFVNQRNQNVIKSLELSKHFKPMHHFP